MSSDKYKHFHLLSVEDLVSFIERKDAEIKNLKHELEKSKQSRDKYYDYNQFHIPKQAADTPDKKCVLTNKQRRL